MFKKAGDPVRETKWFCGIIEKKHTHLLKQQETGKIRKKKEHKYFKCISTTVVGEKLICSMNCLFQKPPQNEMAIKKNLGNTNRNMIYNIVQSKDKTKTIYYQVWCPIFKGNNWCLGGVPF